MKGIFNKNGIASIVIPSLNAINSKLYDLTEVEVTPAEVDGDGVVIVPAVMDNRFIRNEIIEADVVLDIVKKAELNAAIAQYIKDNSRSSEEDAIASVANFVHTVVLVDDSEVPTDRKWRDAWFFDGQIKGNSENARQVALSRLRIVRDKQMVLADIDYTIADGAGDAVAKTVVEQRRTDLRTATDPLKAWSPAQAVLPLVAIEAQLSVLEVLPR